VWKKFPQLRISRLPFPHIYDPSDQPNNIFSFGRRQKDAFFTEMDVERSTLCIGFPDGMRRWLSGYKGANESDKRVPAQYH
jgi:hypothetical protein